MNRHWWRTIALSWMALFLMMAIVRADASPADPPHESGSAVTASPEADGETEPSKPADEGTEGFEDFGEFEKNAGQPVFDPLSGYNRAMTRINDRLYYWVLKPVASGYKFVVAEPVRMSIGRFFVNLAFPVRFVNNLLQLKLKKAGTETVRFIVNTTIGVAGLWDPAGAWMELPAYDEDFGQTLGYYGLGGGFHIVLPLFGPSNVRDACGRIADWFLDPVHYVKDPESRAAVSAERMVNSTSLRLGQYEALTKDSMDLYVLLRDAYENNRNHNIKE